MGIHIDGNIDGDVKEMKENMINGNGQLILGIVRTYGSREEINNRPNEESKSNTK